MSITRVFQVQIHSALRSDFEAKFNTLSKKLVASAPGCISHSVLKPSRWNPDEYALISEWENEKKLVAFAGEKWNESVLPAEMEKYAKYHSTTHFESWE